MYYPAVSVVNAFPPKSCSQLALYSVLTMSFFIGSPFVLSTTGSLTAKGPRTTTPAITKQISYDYRDAYLRPASKPLNCLPKDVRADEVLSLGKGTSQLTVKQKLAQMKARCRGGKLFDAKGREIRFFRVSCWGNPPPDYLEILQRENEQIKKLQQRFTVITFSCSPMIQ